MKAVVKIEFLRVQLKSDLVQVKKSNYPMGILGGRTLAICKVVSSQRVETPPNLKKYADRIIQWTPIYN